MKLNFYKIVCCTLSLVLLLLIVFSVPSKAAIGVYGHSIILKILGKATSETTTSESVYYIYCQTQLWCDGTLKNWNDVGHECGAVAGPVNAYWLGSGEKHTRGYHSKQDTASSSTVSFYTYAY